MPFFLTPQIEKSSMCGLCGFPSEPWAAAAIVHPAEGAEKMAGTGLTEHGFMFKYSS